MFINSVTALIVPRKKSEWKLESTLNQMITEKIFFEGGGNWTDWLIDFRGGTEN